MKKPRNPNLTPMGNRLVDLPDKARKIEQSIYSELIARGVPPLP
jgi:hypothetical protein